MKLSFLERRYVNGIFRNRLQRPLEFWLFNRIAPIPTQAHILEIGCGNGNGLLYLANHYQPASLTGIDIDPAQTGLAEKSLATQTVSHLILTGSATSIPIPAHRYDVIISAGCLHHIPEWQQALAECTRLLRHGGLLYLLEFYYPFLSLPGIRHLFRHPANRFTNAELTTELERLGFIILGTSPTPSNPFKRGLSNLASFSVNRLAIMHPEYD